MEQWRARFGPMSRSGPRVPVGDHEYCQMPFASRSPEPVVIETGPSAHISPEDLLTLRQAYDRLEHESFAARLTNMVGKRVELAGALVPEKAKKIAGRATEIALRAALRVAMRSLDARQKPSSPSLHRSLASAVGAAGGAFGLAALPVELPVSTTLMLRSIADIARGEGEKMGDPETAFACLEVFALGARNEDGDHLESGYFAVRGLIAKSISEAARFVLQRGFADETAPVLVKMITQIASRFGLAVTQKIAAHAIPVIGAVGGAAVNYAFMTHFQAVARGHFAVRRLERQYGQDVIRAEYERLRVEDDDRAARAKPI